MSTYHRRGLAFAKRIYAPRTLGVSVGFITVAVSLYYVNAAHWVWLLAVFNTLIWPHLAYQLAKRSHQPYQAEWRNLLLDSCTGGFWVAAMGFSVLPSVTLLAMMAMHNMAAAGPRLMLQGLCAQALGVLIGLALLNPVVDPHSNMTQIYACLPVLVVYPVFVGWLSHQVTLKLWEHRNILRKLSRTDSLTGLLNHGAWKDLLDLEFAKSRSLHRQCVIALIDIDHFKIINDTYGHLVGDTVLQNISEALVENLRDTDLIGRCGGDEFCVILPDTSSRQAEEILERLRQAIDEFTYALHCELRVSLSIGIAVYTPELTDASTWLHEADKALYFAKSTGRNRVVNAQDAPSERQTLGAKA
ncbi:diguanylate cyclase [Pseudomonas cannabina]|uniref:diguanylate cyclase n=3 Tax=Pseudomonas syringae group TaxID=136849 RepID=A0A3M3QLI6_PSECA|nr:MULTISPECIES: diguanylate cyclase [Pseudomonas syringae group]KPW15526.1 GGDEF domain protein [Pseudomonas cannabina pv. alisalensis]MBM0139896.1 diguanylate cyclase [Pseudomonas cannabina pv. alisalensis]QHE98548.1 diguanylate cyclase [Pseudomonas syringae pv. maculicola str. ES4326]QQN23190.1 diguanylate cyclase [Pseudomonas cannabina pv. alisalensis]RMN85034.1 GGDEF domain protein [Pseudomonas cannabina]